VDTFPKEEMVSMEAKKGPKPKRQRRVFTDEFKAAAVRLVVEEGQSVSTVARDLGLWDSVLHGWVRQSKIDAGRGPSGALTSSEKDELARLRKENRVLKQERDILKKAAAFFARERT